MRIRDRLNSSLARTSAWMFVSQAGLAVIQAIYFICIARALGIYDYGVFAAATALAATVAPFGMFGMSTLVLRNVSRSRELLATTWGNAILTTISFGAVLSIGTTFLAIIALPSNIGWEIVLCIALADVLFANIHYVTAQLHLGCGDARRAALNPIYMNCTRLLAAALLWVVDANAHTWAMLYLGSTVIVAIIGIILAASRYELPRLDLPRLIKELKIGFSYAVGFSSMTIYTDIDKSLVAKLDSISNAGIYTAGFRVVTMGMVPVMALLQASFRGFFKHGEQGVIATARYSRKLLPLGALLGIICGAMIFLCAPLAPIFFGEDFEDSVRVIQLLSVLPLLRVLQNLLADALTGADLHVSRTIIQISVAVINIGLNIVLIPRFGIEGAITASITSNLILLALIWFTLKRAIRKARANLTQPSLADTQTHNP